MTDIQDATGMEQRFVWHPTYAGKSAAEVRSILTEEIGRDQRAYALAMEGAEHSEGASLSAIVELERRWSPYDFDWTEIDAEQLADRIVRFEQERERRQEMIPFAEYRLNHDSAEPVSEVRSSPERSLPIMKIGAGILILLVIIFLVAVVL